MPSSLFLRTGAGASLFRHKASHPPPIPPQPSLWAPTLGFHPDPVQAQILDCADPRLILLCTRQFGKTTLTALKAVHFALTHPGSLTVVASPCERRSGEWIRLVRRFTTSRTDGIHRFSAVLPNGARLIGLPGSTDTNRGYPAHLLIFEEAAFIPDEMFHVLSGSLAATNGRLWLISTPSGQSGFFYHQWHANDLPYARFKVTAEDCPRISKEFLNLQRKMIGETAYAREYLCEFQPADTQLINLSLLQAAADPSYSAYNQGQPLFRNLPNAQ